VHPQHLARVRFRVVHLYDGTPVAGAAGQIEIYPTPDDAA